MLTLLLAAYLLLPRNKVVDASNMDQPPAQEMSRAPQPPAVNQLTPMNSLPLSDLQPDMVDRVEQDALVFKDGTKRQVTPSELSQLPGNLRILLEYNRHDGP